MDLVGGNATTTAVVCHGVPLPLPPRKNLNLNLIDGSQLSLMTHLNIFCGFFLQVNLICCLCALFISVFIFHLAVILMYV